MPQFVSPTPQRLHLKRPDETGVMVRSQVTPTPPTTPAPEHDCVVRTHVNVPPFGTNEYWAFVRAENARLNQE